MNGHLAVAVLLGYGSMLGQEAGEPFRWRPAARMQTARAGHCAVTLPDGRVLVAGGESVDGPLRSVEIYGPGDEFVAGPEMQRARTKHTCTVLEDGRVLAAGGSGEGAAEVLDPVTGTWAETEGDASPVRDHTATLLLDGRVLLAGGWSGEEESTMLRLYDPAANRLRLLGASLMGPRTGHIAARLTDGRVLLAGGEREGRVLASAEFFDPTTETVLPAAAMNLARRGHGAATLRDGRILVVGGNDGSAELGNGEAYVEAEDVWAWIAAPMMAARRGAFVTLLASGSVLIAGGDRDGAALGDTELFDPATDEFVAVGGLTAPRTGIAGGLVGSDGTVLATGGRNADGVSALCGVAATLVVGTARQDGTAAPNGFTSGETVVLAGAGFTSGQTVTFSVRRSDGVAVTRLINASTRLSSSSFAVPLLAISAANGDIGKSFTVTVSSTLNGTASARFQARARVTITASLTNASGLVGAPIGFTVQLSPDVNAGPMSGALTLRVGPLQQTINLSNYTPGSTLTQQICCVTVSGSHAVSVSYAGDVRYQPATRSLSNYQADPSQLQMRVGPLRFSPGLPLFTDTQLVVILINPPLDLPLPGGTVVITRGGFTTGPLPMSSPVFQYKATFADRPQACFNMQYSGDATYQAIRTVSCVDVGPGTSTLEVTTAEPYTFNTMHRFNFRLTWPPELGIVNRTVRLQTPLGFTDANFSNVGVGEATGSLDVLATVAGLSVSGIYFGGGDVARSDQRRTLLEMAPIPLRLELSPVSSPRTTAFDLTATLSCPPCGAVGMPIQPTGRIRFFDGDLFLGETQFPAVAIPVQSVSVTLPNVIRPVGVRSLRAEYAGQRGYLPAVSPVLQVTIQ